MLEVVVLVTVVIVGFKLLNQARRERLAARLTALGFDSDPSSRDNFVSSKTGINYAIRKVRRRKVHYYFLSALIPIDLGTSFSITKRGFFSQLLGINKGDVRLDDRYNISTLDPWFSEKKLAREEFLEFVDQFFSFSKLNDSEIDVFEEGIQLYLYTKYSIDHIVPAILAIDRHAKEMLQTNKVIDEIHDLEYKDQDLSYKCESCGRDIPLTGKYCPFCQAKAPTCVVCRDDPEPSDDVVILTCCRTYAHREHLEQWSRKNRKCPYCNREDPLVVSLPS